MRKVLAFLIVFILCFSLAGHAEEAVSGQATEASKSVVITFTGDCTLGCDKKLVDSPLSFWAYVDEYGYEYPFANLKQIFEQDDLTIINLEGVFSDSAADMANKTYCFRAPSEYVNILTSSSVEAVSFANNHTQDFGDHGTKDTIAALENAGVGWFGVNIPINEYNTPWDQVCGTYIYEKDGVKIGFVAAYISNWWANKNVHRDQFTQLREAGCDLIIACLHGGVEYDPLHDNNQEDFAHVFQSYGADIVIGNHPHVLQGMEVRNTGTVVYSLGNCCFGGNQVIKKTERSSAEYTALMQFKFDFAEDNTYLGYTLTIYPAFSATATEAGYSNYQPRLANEAEAPAILKLIQRDTKNIKLNPYVEGVGAVQEFVPAPAKEE